MWWSVPVMIMALVGEHAAAAWKFVNRTPSLANRSMFGVLISPPKHPGSEKPRSSARMIKKLGFLASVVAGKTLWGEYGILYEKETKMG